MTEIAITRAELRKQAVERNPALNSRVVKGEAVLHLTPLEVGFMLGCVMRARAEDPSFAGFMEPLREKLQAFYPWPEEK